MPTKFTESTHRTGRIKFITIIEVYIVCGIMVIHARWLTANFTVKPAYHASLFDAFHLNYRVLIQHSTFLYIPAVIRKILLYGIYILQWNPNNANFFSFGIPTEKYITFRLLQNMVQMQCKNCYTSPIRFIETANPREHFTIFEITLKYIMNVKPISNE